MSSLFPSVPEIITLTTLALILATNSQLIRKLQGTQTIGLFSSIFRFAWLRFRDFMWTFQYGWLGLGSLATTLILVSWCLLICWFMLVILAVGALLKIDGMWSAVASSSECGGKLLTCHCCCRKSQSDRGLLIPGVLVREAGNALGTYAGFFIQEFFRSFIEKQKDQVLCK